MKLRPEEVWLCAVLQLCSAIIFHELVRAKCQQKMKEQGDTQRPGVQGQ